MPKDCVTLTVPARAEYAKTVRLTAAALVSRLGMNYDELDDVRIAAEEAFVFAVDHAAPEDSISLQFLVDDQAVEIKVGLADGGRVAGEDAERRAEYATFILQGVCDHFELSSDENGSYLKAVKNLPAERPDAQE